MHAAGRNGNVDAKVAQKRPLKRRKSESTNAKPRTKQAKELSRKTKGVRMEKTTKVVSTDAPIRERMFVRTDENCRLKMLPV